MNRVLVSGLLLSAAMLLSGSAEAAPRRLDFGRAFKVMSGSITVPPAWDGLWLTEDSTYDCSDAFVDTSSSLDTLCGGQVFTEAPDESPIVVTCKGTATANAFDVTCTGSSEIFPDCQVTFLADIEGTRTGETYRAVMVASLTYSGTGLGCSFLQDTCERIVTYGTRTGPAPTDFCVTTAVLPTTWGKLKVRYR